MLQARGLQCHLAVSRYEWSVLRSEGAQLPASIPLTRDSNGAFPLVVRRDGPIRDDGSLGSRVEDWTAPVALPEPATFQLRPAWFHVSMLATAAGIGGEPGGGSSSGRRQTKRFDTDA